VAVLDEQRVSLKGLIYDFLSVHDSVISLKCRSNESMMSKRK
jgi:hypothetical protein